MTNERSCPCPRGVVTVPNTGIAPFPRKFKSASLFLSLALVFGVMLFANVPSAMAQGHTTGLNVTKTIVGSGSAQQGSTITVRVTVENQDPDHGVKNLAITNTVPFPGGTTTTVTGCASSLGPSDSVTGSGPDFTTCTFQETLPITCSATNTTLTDQVSASGSDNAPGTIFDNLPVSGSATNTVIVTPLPCNEDTECKTDECVVNVGCVFTNKADSTACTDTVSGDCKVAGCEAGVCVQTHSNAADSTVCTSTPDVAGDCGTPGCEAGVCVADHVPISDSTPCSVGVTGTPDECKTPGCEAGVCVAAHINKADSTACTDTTPACGFTAGCEAGSCVQEHAAQACGQGCTPGFWKANADKKQANAWPVSPDTLLGSIFTIPPCLSGCSQNFANLTLRQALSLQGGNSLCEKAETLLRIATGSFLNASSSCVQFNLNAAALVAEVNGVLASCDASQFISESTKLDEFNNQGCPLNQQGQCSNP